MWNWCRRLGLLGFSLAALVPTIAWADPVTLKFAFFAPDTEKTWTTTIKPFIDAVNAKGKGVVAIEAYPNGALGRNLAQQLQMVLDGVADITFTVLGLTPGRFPDNSVLELPGTFNDIGESTRVFTALMNAGKMRGYEDYFVVGALGAAPSSIHTHPAISSFNDLRGKKIRATNATEADTLRALGAASVLMPVNEAAEAIARGTIDGTTMQPQPMVDFGIARVATYHYFGRVGVVPLGVVMNRKKFESLPKAAQDIIREYSGEWFLSKYIAGVGAENDRVVKELTQDPKHHVIVPEGQELQELQGIYSTVIENWFAKSAGNKDLYAAMQAELGKVKAGR